jgi:Glycosyl transferase family 2
MAELLVIVPTHEHGETLRLSVGSVLAQGFEDLEVAVIGDGADAPTRAAALELERSDPRVRFLDLPKGERHGEAHRHALLAEAGCPLVLYQSDDDLWLPSHAESMRELLAASDFAHSLPVRVDPDGSLGVWPVDLSRSEYRELLLAGENRVPLGCAGHTLAAYRRLPRGWNPAPSGRPTDLHMWQQWLSAGGMRFASSLEPSTLHFPSPDRRGWTPAQRVAELERFRHGGPALHEAVMAGAVREAIARDLEAKSRERQAVEYHEQLVFQTGEAARAHEAAARLSAERRPRAVGRLRRALRLGRYGPRP